MEESPIQWLERRIGHLGRHYQRYLETIRANVDLLTERLEQGSFLEDVDPWAYSSTPDQAMALAGAAGRDQGEKLDFLATYYSLQFLHMNVLAIDRLELGLADIENRSRGFRRFISSQARRYQRLNSCYVDNLLRIFMGDEPLPEFAICVVGTPWDQDDVDIVVLREEGEHPRFNHALGKTCAEFFKRAGRLHLYIAENIGLPGYSGTVREYNDVLCCNLNDFVMISELLSAELLLGSQRLFDEFHKKVVKRFYEARGSSRKFHEAFLRGLLGEIHAQLVHDVHRDSIDFKKDALRLIKGAAQAGRVASGLKDTDPFVVLDKLALLRPDLSETFETLGECALFIEVFRLLYQMLVVQEETVELSREYDPLLESVANVMGYSEKGGISAANHLIVNYFEAVERARYSCRRLQLPLTDYVKQISGYSYATDKSARVKPRNIAVEIAHSVRLFRGHIFFDDVLQALRQDQFALARRFITDAMRLTRRAHKEVLESLAAFASSDPMTLIELMLVLNGSGHSEAKRLFDALLETIFQRMEEEDGLLPGLISVYSTNPHIMNRFIEALSRSQRQRFESFLQVTLWEEEEQQALERLRRYIWLRTAGSEFYRRVFRRVVTKNPQFIHHILDVDRLTTFASGFLALPDAGTSRDLLEALGDYYDVSYLSCAIAALNDAELDKYRVPFVDFVYTYITSLYYHCKKQVASQTPGFDKTFRDQFCLFATGGYSRGQAFDDDYDLILLTSTDEPRMLEFYSSVASCMHREMVRRGTIPQYRFADHFGTFVQPFCQFRDWFLSSEVDTVDKSQLLGARLVLGSSKFATRLHDEVIAPLVLANSAAFLKELHDEMEQRHETFVPSSGVVDVKESPGGLRDVEQIMLMLKVSLRTMGPVGAPFLERVKDLRPDLAADVQDLRECWDKLRKVRDLFRLLVAAQDEVSPEDLVPVAGVLGPFLPDRRGDGAGLFDQTCATMERIVAVGRRLRAALSG